MQNTIKKIFPVLALSIFSSMLGMGIISPILPLYAENLGATGVWLGVIVSGFSISRTVVVPFIGRLSDLKGRKLLLAAGLLAYTIISIGYIWVGSIASLVLVRLLHGVGAGLVGPIAQAYLGDMTPDGEEGKWMGYYNAAMLTGFGCGPLMGGILAEHLGMNSVFYAMGFLNLLAFLGVTLFLPEVAHGEKSTATHSSYREIATSGRIWGLFSVMAGVSAGRGIMMTFLPVFAGINLGLSSSLIGILLTVQLMGSSLLQVPNGRLADRFNRRTMVILASFSMLAGTALIPSSGGFWLLLAFGVLFSLGDSITLPASSAIAVEEGKKLGMGIMMGMLSMAMGIGMGIGPILAGVMADLLTVDFAFYFTAALMLVGTIVFSRLTR